MAFPRKMEYLLISMFVTIKVRVKRDSVNVLQNFNVLRTIKYLYTFPLAIIDLFGYSLRFTSACSDG